LFSSSISSSERTFPLHSGPSQFHSTHISFRNRSTLNFRLIRFLSRPGHVNASSILSSPRYRSNRHNLFHLVSRPAFTGYWILESSLTQPQPPKTSDITIFYLHGGGYFSSQPGTYLLFLLRLAESILVQGQTISIFALDYHLAPEYCYPTQLREAAAAYSYLIKDQRIPPAKIVVAGDSAGAHLALSFLVDLQTSKGKASKPAGLVLISPWLSLHHTPSTNADRDCLSAPFLEATGKRFLGPSFREEEKFSPTLEFLTPQPAIDWDAVLPVWIWVSAGTNEVLFDDIVRWVQGLEDGLGRERVEKAFAEGEVHAWQWLETMDKGAKGRFLEKVGECGEEFKGVEQIGRVIRETMGKGSR